MFYGKVVTIFVKNMIFILFLL